MAKYLHSSRVDGEYGTRSPPSPAKPWCTIAAAPTPPSLLLGGAVLLLTSRGMTPKACLLTLLLYLFPIRALHLLMLPSLLPVKIRVIITAALRITGRG